MHKKSLHEIFNMPPAWSVFDPLMADLADMHSSIDPVALSEALTPLLDGYEQATRPRHFRQTLGGKNSTRHADLYVFSTGLRRRGSLGHRVVRISEGEDVEILDLDRALDDSEIFKPSALRANGERLKKMTRKYGDRLEATLGKGLWSIRRTAKNSCRWVYDLDFVYERSTKSFQSLQAARIAVADAMLQAIDQILPDNKAMRTFAYNQIISCLESFDENREAQNRTLIETIGRQMNADVLHLLEKNPSTRSVYHYNWLTSQNKPETLPFRRELVAACPVVLLIDDYRKKIQPFEGSASIDDVLQKLFHASPERLDFYKNLTEEQTGTQNARKLDVISAYIETGAAAELPLNNPADWSRLSTLIDVSQGFSEALGRPRDRIFSDFVDAVLIDPEGAFLPRIDFDKRLIDLTVFKNRIVTFALAPKIMIEGQLEGLNIPVSHALYMAAENDALDYDAVQGIPYKTKEKIRALNQNQKLINLILRSVPVSNLIESGFFYGVHRGDYDEQLRNLVITNRLAEHGQAYTWAALPSVFMEDDEYSVISLNSQSDLLKTSLETRDDIWRYAPCAITENLHFVAVRRRGGFTDATAILEEPGTAGQPWKVRDVFAASSTRRHNHLHEVVQGYVAMPEFLDQVDLAAIRRQRSQLYRTLSTRAQPNERLGLRDMTDMAERRMKLSILSAHWPEKPGFDIDTHGCISTPVIDARVKALVRNIAPLYRHTPPKGQRLSGPA